MKFESRELALELRKKGLSYSEILKKVPVAKSTLSLWLGSVGLSTRQKQRLTEKKLASMKRGWLRAQENRLREVEEVKKAARIEAFHNKNNPLWLAGTILYWAEGSKNKPWRKAEKVVFTNMDPSAITLFCKWILAYGNVSSNELVYEIYIHPTSNLDQARKYWSGILNVSPSLFRIYFKKENTSPRRKNIGNGYFGVMRVVIKSSTNLLRRIEEWIKSVVEYLH